MAPLHGAPGAWEPRFIEPPEPPVPTPLVTEPSTHCPSHEFGIAAN